MAANPTTPVSQVQFVRWAGNDFAYDSDPDEVVASLSVASHLGWRRVYAWIGQPGATDFVAAFTLNFKLGGVSVGNIGQRIYGTGSTNAAIGASPFFGFGWVPMETNAGYSPKTCSDGLAVVAQNVTSGPAGARTIQPIRLWLQCDEIEFTCSELVSDSSHENFQVFLACLSGLAPTAENPS